MSGKAAAPGRGRLGRFPQLLVQCRAPAADYGKCVSLQAAGKNELTKGACAKEFEALKDCFQKAAKKTMK